MPLFSRISPGGSRDIMVLVCLLYGKKPSMVSHHPVKFGGRRPSVSKDKIILVIEGQNFTCLLKLRGHANLWVEAPSSMLPP